MPESHAAHIARPPRRAFLKGKATRLAIMQAAQSVFAREGFFNAEIGQITEAAGKGKGTFYLYFESKNQLLAAMIEAFADDLRKPTRLPNPIHPPEQMRDVLHAIWVTYKRHAPTFRALSDASTKHQEFASMYRELRAYAQRDFTAMVRARQSAGFCHALDAEFAGIAMETMLNHCIYQWLASRAPLASDAEEARAFQTLVVIMNGILEISPG